MWSINSGYSLNQNRETSSTKTIFLFKKKHCTVTCSKSNQWIAKYCRSGRIRTSLVGSDQEPNKRFGSEFFKLFFLQPWKEKKIWICNPEKRKDLNPQPRKKRVPENQPGPCWARRRPRWWYPWTGGWCRPWAPPSPSPARPGSHPCSASSHPAPKRDWVTRWIFFKGLR